MSVQYDDDEAPYPDTDQVTQGGRGRALDQAAAGQHTRHRVACTQSGEGVRLGTHLRLRDTHRRDALGSLARTVGGPYAGEDEGERPTARFDCNPTVQRVLNKITTSPRRSTSPCVDQDGLRQGDLGATHNNQTVP